jgi:competence protein ComEC
LSRIDGFHDDRMLVPALCMWAAALLVGFSVQWALVFMVCLQLCALLIALVIHHRCTSDWSQTAITWVWTLVVCSCAVCCAIISGGLSMQVSARDPLVRLLDTQEGSYALVNFRVRSPAVASSMRGQECQFQADSLQVQANQAIAPSHVPVIVMGSGKVCHAVDSGEYAAHARVRRPRYGQASCWLEADDTSLQLLVKPRILQQTVHQLQSSFIQVCSHLDQQARILVPGVTIGVLGQDAIAGQLPSARSSDVQMGKKLKGWFKQVGIVHLLAVSGGHFLLITDFVRRRCAIVHVPRVITAGLMMLSCWGLAVLMFPSDSVTRALCMGMIGAAALARGRKSQSISALSWTICGGLIFSPSLARSFGFALSCAAVLGIILFSSRCTELFSSLPDSLRQAIGVTMSAQLLTYPIQFLIKPNVTVMSLPANICVAPVVSFSTICGLVSLLTSWCFPQIGFACAWLSGRGTWVMAQCARFFASLDPQCALPHQGSGSSSGSPLFALEVCGLEVAVFAVIEVVKRVRRHQAARLLARSDSQWESMSKEDTNLKAWHSR